jgi:hypothetical protein
VRPIADSKKRHDDDDDDSRNDSSALHRRLAQLEALIREPKPSDLAALAQAQLTADRAYSAIGDSAPRPLVGENPFDYRVRLANAMKGNSTAWKNVDLTCLPEAALAIAETQIYADSVAAAARPDSVPPGELRMIKKIGESGHIIHEFYGQPDSWMQNFTTGRRAVTAINRLN